MAKNYYAILGISSGAKANEVRASYRRLVKEFYPDHYSGGSEIFQQIQEAYSVLSDDRKRRQYDQQLINAKADEFVRQRSYPGPEPLIPEKKPDYFGDLSLVRSFQTFVPSFDEIFDWLWANFSDLNQPKSRRVQNLTLEIVLTNEQALLGGNAKVMVPARAKCPTCRGYGVVGSYECSRCAGEGAIIGEIPILVAFPPGLIRDHAVTIPLERFGIRNIYLTVLFRISEI
ncbi:MAG: DnaJ domain-containing protein [Syntrophales bacterium]|jgi:DnaJ-class molecular chaperone